MAAYSAKKNKKMLLLPFLLLPNVCVHISIKKENLTETTITRDPLHYFLLSYLSQLIADPGDGNI